MTSRGKFIDNWPDSFTRTLRSVLIELDEGRITREKAKEVLVNELEIGLNTLHPETQAREE